MNRWLLNINAWCWKHSGWSSNCPIGYRGKYRQASANGPLEHSQQWLVLWAKLSRPTQPCPFVHVRSVAAFPLQLQGWVISRAVTFPCSLKHLGPGLLHGYWPRPTRIRAFQITLVSHDITNIFGKGLRIQGGLENASLNNYTNYYSWTNDTI